MEEDTLLSVTTVTKRPPKTIKEKRFVKEYLKSGNATEAAAKVYDVSNLNSAHAIGSQNLQRLTISDELDKIGLTDSKIASVLLDAIDAQKTVSSYNTNREANAETDDFIDIPDWQARLKAIEITAKMKGHFIEKRDITSKGERISNGLVEFVEDVKDQAS